MENKVSSELESRAQIFSGGILLKGEVAEVPGKGLEDEGDRSITGVVDLWRVGMCLSFVNPVSDEECVGDGGGDDFFFLI